MQSPSNKVGIVLLVVVCVVTGTIVLSRIDFSSRNTNDDFATPAQIIIEKKIKNPNTSWFEEFERTKPTHAAPKTGEFDASAFVPGSVTEQMSIDLFAEYLVQKQKGFLTPDDEIDIARKIAGKVTSQADFSINKYTISDINITQSTPMTVAIYGDRLAQVVMDNFIKMDSVRNLQGVTYLKNIASLHRDYLQDLLTISVPDVVQDVHVELINGVHNTGVFFDVLTSDIQDPVIALTILAQYQVVQADDVELFTLLAMYFENNGIIFDTESTVNFWNRFY